MLLAVIVVLSASLLAGGCGQRGDGTDGASPVGSPAAGAADITGDIVEMMPGQSGSELSVVVVADPDVSSTYDRASVRVTESTLVWAPAGEGRHELTSADLKEGQRVAVRFEGPVAESYPVQATAGDVEILSPLP